MSIKDYERVREMHKRICDNDELRRFFRDRDDRIDGATVIVAGIKEITGYEIDMSFILSSVQPFQVEEYPPIWVNDALARITRRMVSTYRLLTESNGNWEYRRKEISAELNRLSICAYIEDQTADDLFDLWSDEQERLYEEHLEADAYNDEADAAEERVWG